CRGSTRGRGGREHAETGGGALGLGWGMGARRIRHRCADWRGFVAAGLLLLLSGLRLFPRVWLWLRLPRLYLRLRLSVLLLRRLLPALLRRGLLGGGLWVPPKAGGGVPHSFRGPQKNPGSPCPRQKTSRRPRRPRLSRSPGV